ncbi:MAG: acetyl-CoA carboxylase biotin carboxyl carrier protein [Oscillospiraceae bacterium]|nr:acetyl-CoA carboxylase biotin carboxyl carrier protein [Oscillospiraceae bacterium]
MDIKAIRALAEIMRENGLSQVEIVEEGKTIRMEREPSVLAVSQPTVPAAVFQAPVMAAPKQETAPVPAELPEDGEIIESPMVGMYYEASAPGAQPFVKIGSRVQKGDVLCMIEAMKTMNEITCDCDGEIVQIYAGNGQLVEVGQRLFCVREA